MDDQRLGAAVRAVRIRRRLRQADVARLAGVSQTTVSRIERGHLGPLSIDVLRWQAFWTSAGDGPEVGLTRG